MKRLYKLWFYRKYSRKSSSLESKNFVDESGLIKSKLNIIKKEQYHLQCYSFTKNKTFLGEHTNHDHKLYITETALRRLLNGKFNNGIQFIQFIHTLFYFDSQFIPQQNFQNLELLKIWEQFKVNKFFKSVISLLWKLLTITLLECDNFKYKSSTNSCDWFNLGFKSSSNQVW